MNFTLNAGGMISRIVRGIPDEGKIENSTGSPERKGYYYYGSNFGNDKENDSQPDVFFLNANGANYKFTFDQYQKAHFYPDADIKLEVTWIAVSTNSNVGKFTNWKVTMPDGTKYFFSGAFSEDTFEIEAQEAQGSLATGTSAFVSYWEKEQVTSAWYLTKIESAFGHQTLFDYYTNTYAFFKLAEQEKQTDNCDFTGISKKINKVFVKSAALTKISNRNIEVEFNKGNWLCGYNTGGIDYCVLDPLAANRLDIDVWNSTLENASSAKILKKISVHDKNTTTSEQLEWIFDYDYNVGYDLPNNPPFGYTYAQTGNTHLRRLKLRKLQLPDNTNYKFTYFDDGFPLPTRFTMGIDHWGFLNGATGATLLIGQDSYRNCANNTLANRSASVGWSQYGTLTGFYHSMGGNTILEYENHEARNYSGLIGGSRIKKITQVDSVSNIKTVKTYSYTQTNGTSSSGFLCLKPVYKFDSRNADVAGEFWNSALYSLLLSESGKPAVGYSRVKETIQSGAATVTATDNIGYSVSEFNQPLTEINIRQIVLSNCPTSAVVGITPPTPCDTLKLTRPWLWLPYHENNVGIPSRVAIYNKNNQLLSEKTTVYEEINADNFPFSPFALANRAFRLNGKNYSFESGFYEYYTKFRVKSDTSKAFSQDGTKPVVSITSHTYKDEMSYSYKTDYPGKHNQVVKTETTNSDGINMVSLNKYAADFVFGRDSTYGCVSYDTQLGICLVYGYIYTPHEPTNPEAKGIYQLQQKNILHGVVESISLQNGYYTGAAYQTYYPKDSVTFSAALPKSNFVLENMPRSNFIQAKYTRTTSGETWTKDPDYDLKTTTEVYNAIGLPIKVSAKYGTSSKTDYDVLTNTLPIKTYKNLGAYDEQTMQTEYNVKIFGVSKETGTNNLEMRKEYYPDGKLKQVKDKDGKVLKHIEYLYRGETSTITSGASLATDQQKNRIIIRVPRIATTDATALDYTDCLISIQYMDGFDRAMQTVGYRASPTGKDLISGTSVYDTYGRAYKSFLPVESPHQDGRYISPTVVESTAIAFYTDSVAYSEVIYENSPMSRPIKSFGVGKAWRTNNKFTESKYETAGTGITRFYAYYNANAGYTSTYNGNQLAKKTLVDERGSIVIEYTNKSGNVVRRDVQVDLSAPSSRLAASGGFLTTAYVYDETERLRYILPPKAYDTLSTMTVFTETGNIFNELVYAYHYDGRNRVYESHSPGIGWSRVIYNRLNQAVMSQDDDELAKNNTWNYVQTDGQGRTVRTGQVQLPSNFTRTYLQNLFDGFTDNQQFEERSTVSGNIQQYTNRSFPITLRSYITDASWKTHTYYDDYTWTKKSNWDNASTEANYDFQVHPFSASRYVNSKGLSTGTKIKHEIWGDNNFFSSVNYYDDKNRVIENITTNHLLKRNQADFQYNFIGETLRNRTIQRKDGTPDQIVTHRVLYDHVGRTKETFYTLTQGTIKKIDSLKMVSFAHDAIGRIRIKFVQPNSNVVSSVQSGLWTTTNIWQNGVIPSLTTPVVINSGHTVTIHANATVQAGTLYDAGILKFLTNSKLQLGTLAPVKGAALQVLEYSYNVRGQLRGVNLNANENPQVSQDKLFSYKIDYHEDGRYFDGSISKQTWLSKTPPSVAGGLRSYLYTYDRANRLTNAQYSGVGNENYSVSQSYDVNGNIQNLQRNSKTGANTWGLVDNLTYGYLNTGNKLQKVDDAVTGNISANDFKDVSGNDYAYSVDGKLTKDGNKNITNIRYNYLDLVSTIKFANGDSVSYSYSSTGSRIQRKVTKAGQPDSYTIYDGSMVYTYAGASPTLASFGISEIQNSEGRYVNGKLEYGYTDHVGNLRLSYKDSLGVAVVTQSQSYDPWSNVNFGSEYYLSGNQGDRYLVSGKETDNLTGNILLDWRDYDSVTGRMNSFDPANQSMSMSGYAYCGNNPVMRIDPDGRFAFVPMLMSALFSGHISGMISGMNGGSYGKSFLNGFATSMIGCVVGAGMGSILGKGLTLGGSVARGVLGGAISGGIAGGIGSMIQGGTFADGFTGGAISGGISGGIMAGIGHLSIKAKIYASMDSYSEAGANTGPVRNPEEFTESIFGKNYKEVYGNPVLRKGSEMPSEGLGDYYYDAESKWIKNSILKNEGSVYGGITKVMSGSTTIYISDARLAGNADFLTATIGHELIHSYHHFIGLSIEYNKKIFYNNSETAAYQWEKAFVTRRISNPLFGGIYQERANEIDVILKNLSPNSKSFPKFLTPNLPK
jgi:RHS repeat-associated protein